MSGIQQLLLGANSGAAAGGGGGAAVPFELLKVQLSANSTVNDYASFNTISVYDTNNIHINSGGFSVSTTNITVPSTGLYLVCFNCSFYSAVARTNVSVQLRNATQSTQLGDVSSSNYIRNASSHNYSSTHLSTIYEFNANDNIQMQFRIEANTGTVNLRDASTIEMLRVG